MIQSKKVNINEKFYDGFEGEPEIFFCLMEKHVVIEKIGIWDGYFNEIMETVRPEKEGWTGLAYFYHLYTGWYEEGNWLLPDVSAAYRQFENIDVDQLKNRETKEVLALVTDLLKRAVDKNEKVCIMYD